jgi:hypothetical protein
MTMALQLEGAWQCGGLLTGWVRTPIWRCAGLGRKTEPSGCRCGPTGRHGSGFVPMVMTRSGPSRGDTTTRSPQASRRGDPIRRIVHAALPKLSLLLATAPENDGAEHDGASQRSQGARAIQLTAMDVALHHSDLAVEVQFASQQICIARLCTTVAVIGMTPGLGALRQLHAKAAIWLG